MKQKRSSLILIMFDHVPFSYTFARLMVIFMILARQMLIMQDNHSISAGLVIVRPDSGLSLVAHRSVGSIYAKWFSSLLWGALILYVHFCLYRKIQTAVCI